MALLFPDSESRFTSRAGGVPPTRDFFVRWLHPFDMDYATNSTAQEAMWGGFIPFCLCSLWGLRLLWRGWRGDILDSSGMARASRSWFVIGGLLLQAPLVGYTVFAWKQGLFRS